MSSRVLTAAEAVCAPIMWTELGPGHDEALSSSRARRPLPFEPLSEPSPPPADWDRLLLEARDEGRREAEAAARLAAAEETASLHARLARSIEEVATLRPRLRIEAERQVVELSLLVAKRILRREISLDPAAVAGLVRSALDGLSLREVVCIRCHPSSAGFLQPVLERLGAPPSIRLEPGPGLETGAALIETVSGVLDASVSTQLEEIERGFVDLLESSVPRRP